MLGHAPDAFAALDRNFGADGQVEDELAQAVVVLEQRRQQARRGAGAVRAGDGDAELDVLADVGDG